MRIGVLNNLRAGKRDSRVAEVLAFLRRHPDIPHVETGGDADVPGALAALERAGVDVLVLNGGDGTVQLALSRLLGPNGSGWRPWIAPIAGGRTNVTARDLGAHRSAVQSLEGLVRARREERLEERQILRSVLRVEHPSGIRYGTVLGAGMLHRAVDLTHRSFPPGRAQGALGAGLVTAMLLARAVRGSLHGVLTPDKMRIAWEGRVDPPKEYLVVVATTLNRLFLRVSPFWGKEDAPIRFTAIEAGCRHVPRNALGVLFGRPGRKVLPEAGYHSHNVRSLELRLDAGLVLDGELIAPEPDCAVRVSAVEGVRFLRA
jgi:diacylglycerol kinase (ATP)